MYILEGSQELDKKQQLKAWCLNYLLGLKTSSFSMPQRIWKFSFAKIGINSN